MDQYKLGSATALGPAALFSIGVAMNHPPGSQILICTDGLANTGLGAFSKSKDNKLAELFYD